MIDPDGLDAPYIQLAGIIRDKIVARELVYGSRLPAQSEMQAEYQVGRNTVRKAMEKLKQDGYITTAPGRGLFVIYRPGENAENNATN